MRTLSLFSLLSSLMLILSSCTTRLPADVEAILVPSVDLEQYAGLWYQVARYPHSFQSSDCALSTAEYTLREDGKVEVLNRCWVDSYQGEYSSQVRALARSMSAQNNHLKVLFFGIFPADYLIIELDEKTYQWAAVTTPSRKSLWILSRTPSLELSIYSSIVESLVSKGFVEGKIIKTSGQR